VVNDEAIDYDRLKAEFHKLHDSPKLFVKVMDLARDGRKYAWRHVEQGKLPDGKEVVVHVFWFGKLDGDGRVVRQTESVRS